MKRLFFIMLVSICLTSCNSCLNKFYGVHEPLTPYRLEIKIRKGSEGLIRQKIDSLNSMSVGLCSYTSVELAKGDRVLCFSKPACECYYLGIQDKKVTVYAVTLPEKKESGWLFYKEELDTFEDRVTERINHFIQTAAN